MKTIKSFVLILFLTILMAACDSETMDTLQDPEDCEKDNSCNQKPSPDNPKPDPNDPQNPNNPKPDPDDPDNPKPDPNCTDPCETSALKCDKNTVFQCNLDENNCPKWEKLKDCEAPTYCNPNTNTCTPCAETCNPNALKRCSLAGIETCTSDENNCAKWTLSQTCPTGQSCNPQTLLCAEGCHNLCNNSGSKKCEANNIFQCTDTNGDNCLEWHKMEECGEKRTCNASTFVCDAKPTTDYTSFSLILMPDTQYYTEETHSNITQNTYYKQTKWIADNIKNQNIKAVLHLGDITDDNTKKQWDIANEAHKILDNTNIPYAISTGNHDYKGSGLKDRARTQFGQYFGDFRFKGKSWYHKSPFPDNSYITFEVGEKKFLVLALEFAPRKDVLCWADELLQNQYHDHHVIISTHNYLKRDKNDNKKAQYSGAISDGTNANPPDANYGHSGAGVFRELAARHSNVFMVVCGHQGGSVHRQKTGYNGNKILEMLVDYQFEARCDTKATPKCNNHCSLKEKNVDGNGNGWLRQLKYDPKTDTLKATTFSVLQNKTFLSSTPQFYCSKINKAPKHHYYDQYPHEINHDFSVESIGIAAPPQYKYSTDNYLGFDPRDINKKGAGDQSNPAVAVNPHTGAFVAVWQDSSDDKKLNNIKARIFHPGSCAKTEDLDVFNASTGKYTNPDVAMDSKGNFVVVWADDSNNNKKFDIYMKGFDANGNQRFMHKKVNKDNTGEQNNPKIAMNPNGDFVIAWEDKSDKSHDTQVFITGFNANGDETFEYKNILTPAGTRKNPDIAMADDGTFVVTWEDDTDGNKAFNIHAMVFNADGTRRTPDQKPTKNGIVVNTNTDHQQLNPSIAITPNGKFYIAYDNQISKGGNYQIKVRGFDLTGKEIFKDTDISDTSYNKHNKPTLCVDNKGQIALAWTQKSYDGDELKSNSENIHYATCKNETCKDKTTLNIDTAATDLKKHTQNQPAIACTNSGAHVLIWQDDSDNNDSNQLYGRGYNTI